MNGTISDSRGPVIDWLAGRGRFQRLGLAVVAGALMTAGHAPISIPWVWFLAMPVLVLQLFTAPTGRAAAWIGWGAAFGYFVTGLHWIGHAFLVEPDRFAWLLPLGIVALPIFFGLFWALAFWAVWHLHARTSVGCAALLAVTLTLLEYARGNLLTGLPWALPGYIWADLPPMQAAAWIGPYGLTLVTLLVTGLTMLGFVDVKARALGAAALVAGNAIWITSAIRLPDTVAYDPDAIVLRVVQPNAPQHLKWKPGHRDIYYQRMLEATARAPDARLGAPDIVIWPEAAVHFVVAATPGEVGRISAAAGDAWVILGALHGERTATGDRWSNAVVSIQPDGELGPRYDKHHLVPFGEYLPMKPVFDALGLSQFAVRGGFTPGPGPQTLTLDSLPPFSPLICYEAIFPDEVVGDTRPAWLVQPTNDAWFGSWAGPRQHYVQARFRAVEQGLPLVRAANTGISALIDPYGREVAAIGLHRFDHFDAMLPSPLPPTAYSRVGDWPALIVALLGLLAGFAVRNRP